MFILEVQQDFYVTKFMEPKLLVLCTVKPALRVLWEVVYLNTKLRKILNAGYLTLITDLGSLKFNVRKH